MRNLAMMWVLAGVVGLFGCGGDSDGLTWYCGPEEKSRAVKAVLKDGTLTVSGKGAMRSFSETRVVDVMFGFENNTGKTDAEVAEIFAKAYKPYRAECWPPWSFAAEYDSTVLITAVIITEGVTHIGKMAFAGLPELKSITIPAGVSSIGWEALAGVDFRGDVRSLIAITVAADNAHYSSDDGVLFNKNKTTLILYPSDKQQDTYTIPDSVTAIEKSAFNCCENLKSITIPNSVTSIGRAAFLNCTGLTSVTIPNSVTYIGLEAFSNCTGLASVTIPDNMTSIPYGAFLSCKSLTSVTIHNSVTSIEGGAFMDCDALVSITIPQSVTSIGRMAFDGCDSLKSITLQNSIPPEIGEYAFDEISPDACFYVPMGSIDAYRNADGWKEFKCIKSIASAPK
jgi:hypothetical protein